MTDKTDALIEQVERMVGMGHEAWDTINQREIASAFREALKQCPCCVQQPAEGNGMVYQWHEFAGRWEDFTKEQFDEVQSSGEIVLGETIITPAMTRKLYTTPPAASVDVEELRKIADGIDPKIGTMGCAETARRIRALIDSAGGAKGEGCGICGGYCDHPELHTPQPAEGDGAVFRGLDSNGRPIYGTHPTARTTTTDSTRPAATAQVPDDGRWITQTVFYDPAVPHETASGNCTQAAVASILGLRLEQVPDWTGLKANDFWEAFEAFFESRGFDACLKDGSQRPSGMYLASGQSERGCSHMVVMQDGKLLHDPHPSRAGVKSVEHIWLLVPKDPAVAAAPAAPKGGVVVAREIAEKVQDALGRFVGDEGWCGADMETVDAFSAALANQQQP